MYSVLSDHWTSQIIVRLIFFLALLCQKTDLSNEVIKNRHEIYLKESGILCCDGSIWAAGAYKKALKKLVCLLSLTKKFPLVIVIEKSSVWHLPAKNHRWSSGTESNNKFWHLEMGPVSVKVSLPPFLIRIFPDKE